MHSRKILQYAGHIKARVMRERIEQMDRREYHKSEQLPDTDFEFAAHRNKG